MLKHSADLAECDIRKAFDELPHGCAVLKVFKRSSDRMSFDGKASPRLSQRT